MKGAKGKEVAGTKDKKVKATSGAQPSGYKKKRMTKVTKVAKKM